MIELLKILLSLSLSGTLLILVLLLCKPLYKNRLSRQWQYYIWLIAVARLLLPFTPETSLSGNLFREVDSAVAQISTIGPADSRLSPETDFAGHDSPSDRQADTPPGKSPELEKALIQRVSETAAQNIWLICVLIWLIVAVGLLIRKVTIYQSFVKYINAGRTEVTDMRLWEQLGKLVEQAGVKSPVELYANSLISSPLLIGFLHPCIILPTAELSDSDLKNTILHELTHYKRRDMSYKWLVQAAVCFHWFNPFVYLMGREINRACEFSCDEAVIRTFDREEQRAYGDTLLNALNQGGKYKDPHASVTLNENTEILKERLDAIMVFKKKSKIRRSITAILTAAVCCGAVYVGAYAAPVSPSNQLPVADTIPKADVENRLDAVSPTPPVVSSGDHVTVSFNGVSVTGQGPVGVELVKSQNPDVAFELLNMDKENTCTTDADIIEGIMQITVNNDAPNGINVDFGPEYENVVRVHIPDAVYTRFDIQTTEMVVRMQDFHAPVYVEANRAGFWLIDDIISQGTYDIHVSSGPVYIEADTILNDITADAVSGPLTVQFNRVPANLYLDTTNCGPSVDRPDDWPAIYTTGSGTPEIILSNTGRTTVEVRNISITDK